MSTFILFLPVALSSQLLASRSVSLCLSRSISAVDSIPRSSLSLSLSPFYVAINVFLHAYNLHIRATLIVLHVQQYENRLLPRLDTLLT